MWGAINALAEKAQAVAADLEGQINESVGIEPAEPTKTESLADDDVWKDDDFDFDDEIETPVERAPSNGHKVVPTEESHPVEADDVPGNGSSEKDAAPGEENVPEDSGWEGDDNDDLELDDTEGLDEGEEPVASPEPNHDLEPPQADTQGDSSINKEISASTSLAPSGALGVSNDEAAGAHDSENKEVWNEDSEIDVSEQTGDETADKSTQHEIKPSPDTEAANAVPDKEMVDAPAKMQEPESNPPFVENEHEPLQMNDATEAGRTEVEASVQIQDEAEIAAAEQKNLAEVMDQDERDVEDASPSSNTPAVVVDHSAGNGISQETASGDESHGPDSKEKNIGNGNRHAWNGARDKDTSQVLTSEASAIHSSEAMEILLQEKEAELESYRKHIEQLQTELGQRESQLFSKTEQLTSMQAMFESEKKELIQMVEHTKTEAKRRIQIAKERVEKAEAQVSQLSRGQSEDSQKQAQIISELRSEGEKLALKQAEMEKAVRSAKGEARKYREAMEEEQAAKETALQTIEELKSELKTTKESLALARKGESQASKLDSELHSAREDAERKASTILSLEQQVKELKAEAKELVTELEAARKGAAIETEREQKKLRKEQSHLIDDFETKLQNAEKEAAVREDALRLEVTELRKRWQDAVRRADTLSMDVQSSTAPLMRQLESMEKQNRARAAAWTELETKLREELEETVIANEKLVKEKSEMKTKVLRMERSCKENEADLCQARNELEEKTYKVKELEDKLLRLEEEAARRKKEWAEVERLANEGVARVRSEMSQTMLEADERHRSQIDSLQAELRSEREKRVQLEEEVEELVEKVGAIVPVHTPTTHMHRSNSAPTPKLRKSEGQAEILAGALNLSGMSDDEMDDDLDGEGEVELTTGSNSFAALEELTSRLKSTKIELNTLRKSLEESEKSRNALMEELTDARTAREKLPLFEARVQELTTDNERLSLEVQGLQEDIADVRELYRAQLNALLEEKALAGSQPDGAEPPYI